MGGDDKQWLLGPPYFNSRDSGKDALEMQRQVGISLLTHGEYRRSWFAGALAESVVGIIDDPDAVAVRQWQGPHGEQPNATTAGLGYGKQVVGTKLRCGVRGLIMEGAIELMKAFIARQLTEAAATV